MFGAISLEDDLPACARPLSRARSTKSRERSENVWARIARAAQGQEVSPMKSASRRDAADPQVGVDDQQHGERGMTSTMLVSMFSTSSTSPPR